ncbi:EscS/YscS/HrcS family type III secretion system export apparatus protein, partial [Priestia megaterium]
VAVLVGIVFFGPWMLSKMISFTYEIFSNLYRYVG